MGMKDSILVQLKEILELLKGSLEQHKRESFLTVLRMTILA